MSFHPRDVHAGHDLHAPDIASACGLWGVLAHQAALRPTKLALKFESQAWTYAALDTAVAQAVRQLQARGVRAGDRVAYLGLNHAAQLVALFALAQLGAVLVPLNFRLAPGEWDMVLQDCTPGALCHDDAWADAAQALAARHGLACWPVTACLTPTASPPETADPWMRPAPAWDDAPVLLVYTSGTTGQPKGAVHTQANLLANMQAAAQVQALQPSDHVLTVLPLFHVGGLCIQTLPALWAGASVCLLARFEPTSFLQAVVEERPSLTLLVPAVMKALIEHPQWASTALESLRAVWAGSSSLPSASVQAFLDRGIPLCNVYGATETGPFSIALPEQQAYSHVGDCGWPAPGVSACLAPPEAAVTGAQDGVGEVWLRGPAVVTHYWPNIPALDAQGWFHSGDLGARGPDGSWRIVGRAKDMIISGGENIYPAEIENLLLQHPAVLECAVLGQPDPRWGEVVVAVVVLRAQDVPAPSDEVLLASVRSGLARYKHPRRVVRVSALPKTALGKVQKDRLRAQL
jgi:fatty-acyl-CoA synthase